MVVTKAPLSLTLASLVPLLVATGCEPDDEVDYCAAQADPVVLLGQGVGGAFEPLEDGQVVGLDVAPQGGFGVTVLIQTTGLFASDDAISTAQLDVEIGGAPAGSFLLDPAPLLCLPDNTGGRISVGTVVGLDPNVYSTNNDLVALDGMEATLDVTVTDEAGHSATTRKLVTISSGG